MNMSMLCKYVGHREIGGGEKVNHWRRIWIGSPDSRPRLPEKRRHGGRRRRTGRRGEGSEGASTARDGGERRGDEREVAAPANGGMGGEAGTAATGGGAGRWRETAPARERGAVGSSEEARACGGRMRAPRAAGVRAVATDMWQEPVGRARRRWFVRRRRTRPAAER